MSFFLACVSVDKLFSTEDTLGNSKSNDDAKLPLPTKQVIVPENSLPTYEEATGIVGHDEFGYIAPSVPASPTLTHNYVNDNGRTNQHSSERTPISQEAPRDQDVERALSQTMLQHEDPLVREMARTVLEECRRAKEKREMKAVVNVFVFFVAFVLFMVFIAVKATT